MNELHIQQNFDTLAEYFGFTQDELANLLYVNNAFIAGSAALNVFTQTELFKDFDLNIFYGSPSTNEGLISVLESNEGLVSVPIRTPTNEGLISVLESKGYKYIDQDKNRLLFSNIEPINIITYANANLKKIQIITLSDCSIKNFMDNVYLNINRLAITGSNCKLQFYMDHLTDQEITEIKHKTMYIYYLSKDNVIKNLMYLENLPHVRNCRSLEKLIKKYIDHGFGLIRYNEKTVIGHMIWPQHPGYFFLYDQDNNAVMTYEEFIKEEIKYRKN